MDVKTAIALAQRNKNNKKIAKSYYLAHDIATWIERYSSEKNLPKSTVVETLLRDAMQRVKEDGDETNS